MRRRVGRAGPGAPAGAGLPIRALHSHASFPGSPWSTTTLRSHVPARTGITDRSSASASAELVRSIEGARLYGWPQAGMMSRRKPSWSRPGLVLPDVCSSIDGPHGPGSHGNEPAAVEPGGGRDRTSEVQAEGLLRTKLLSSPMMVGRGRGCAARALPPAIASSPLSSQGSPPRPVLAPRRARPSPPAMPAPRPVARTARSCAGRRPPRAGRARSETRQSTRFPFLPPLSRFPWSARPDRYPLPTPPLPGPVWRRRRIPTLNRKGC